MRFVSWNVNGIRAILKKDFYEIFDQFGVDAFAVQETKVQPGQVELELPGYNQFFSYADKKGYSGTAIFCKELPRRVLHGLGSEYLDSEGRLLAVEFDELWLVNVYTPNSQSELARIAHRMEWDDAFRDFCKGLEEGTLPGGVDEEFPQGIEMPCEPKPVVMCGDFNVARLEIDLKHPDRHVGDVGFSDEERGKINELIDAGFVDTFREVHPDLTDKYSWWSYKFGARKTNAGWRLDYFFVSESLVDKIEGAYIYDDVMGSDHCPVGLDLAI